MARERAHGGKRPTWLREAARPAASDAGRDVGGHRGRADGRVASPQGTRSPEHALIAISTGQDDWARRDWNRFAAASPDASLYHRAEFRDVIDEVFRQPSYYLSARDAKGAVTGILPLVRLRSRSFGDFLVSLPYFNYGGAIADDAATRTRLERAGEELARELRVGHVEFRDTAPRGDATPVRTDKRILERSLPGDVDTLWRELGSKLRAQVRKPLKNGATAVIGGHELVAPFYHVFARNMRDLGTPVYARGLFESICNHLGPDAHIVIVYVGDQPAAGGVLLQHRARMQIPWAASLQPFNTLGVNMLLYWEALALAVRSGCDVFDFGRSTIDSGTERFKRQWGAVPRPLYWHYWLSHGGPLPALNPDNPKYRLAVRAWQRMPVALANRLGPHIVRNLP
jgi:FemAB-related protein (PEP-CTERM system-associated)